LGISAFYHDSAASLIHDGRIVAAAQEERFTRKKHDHRFPEQAIAYCLSEGGISAGDISYVSFYDKPFLKFERLLETYISFSPAGLQSYMKAMPLWLKEKLWMGDSIRNSLPAYAGEIYYPEHHQSHAASAFFPSPFEEAAFITMDGVGEWATASWGTGKGNKIDLHSELHFPHSLGLLYTAFTYYTGFKVNNGEYKVMGLAPYGTPKYAQTIYENLIDLRDDGSFRLDMDYFNYCQGLTMTSERFHKLFGGPPRKPESEITQREMDLAASVQAVTEEVMLRTARHVRKETGLHNLCLAGGVALNCVANGKILREGIFDDIWIQPAAGDAGGSLGAALFVWYQILENQRTSDGLHDLQQGSYLGPEWNDGQIESWLDAEGYPHIKMDEKGIIDTVAGEIADGRVIGWFSGRMEFGPRALGNRSIIGDARSETMQSIINLKIKYRESFRPFAPSVLVEDVDVFFDIDRPSPYMLLVAPVAEDHRKFPAGDEEKLFGLQKLRIPRSDIPAVTHVDYSSRLQTVSAEDNPRYHSLISRFKDKTGYGIVINTSFNVRGEPIVCNPEDAYMCFMRTEMDTLALGNFLLKKEDQPVLDIEAESLDSKRTKGKAEDIRELRKFGFVMAGSFTVISAILFIKGSGLLPFSACLSAVFLISASLFPGILRPIERFWMKLASIMGSIMSRILLTLVYFLAVVPTGFLLRIFGMKPLKLDFDTSKKTYWVDIDTAGPCSRPDKQY
jgi:carbamoyltransferase